MPASIGLDIATAAATTLGLTLGTQVFASPPREDGEFVTLPAVFVMAHGGVKAMPLRADSPREIKPNTVHVDVRALPDDFEGGNLLAYNAREAIGYAVPAGYIDVQPIESYPMYLGQNENGSHCWAMNFRVDVEE